MPLSNTTCGASREGGVSWILEQDMKVWDAQIEADAKAGKLGHLISEAKADYTAGKARKL